MSQIIIKSQDLIIGGQIRKYSPSKYHGSVIGKKKDNYRIAY